MKDATGKMLRLYPANHSASLRFMGRLVRRWMYEDANLFVNSPPWVPKVIYLPADCSAFIPCLWQVYDQRGGRFAPMFTESKLVTETPAKV